MKAFVLAPADPRTSSCPFPGVLKASATRSFEVACLCSFCSLVEWSSSLGNIQTCVGIVIPHQYLWPWALAGPPCPPCPLSWGLSLGQWTWPLLERPGRPECLSSLHLPFSASAPSAVSTFISILIASIGYFLKAYLWEHISLEFLWPLSMDTGQGCGLCVLGFYMLPACVSFPWSCGFAPSRAPCLSSWVFLISSSSCMKQYCPVDLPMMIEVYLYLCYPSGSQEPHIALEHLRCDWGANF